jgi:riboflavin biosynthesis pyrimidine reductase
VSTRRTRIERSFEPEVVRRLVQSAGRDVSAGGSELAAQALRAGLVDDPCLLLAPVVAGGGKPALPGGVHLPLELLDERRFAGGTVFLRYRVSGGAR